MMMGKKPWAEAKSPPTNPSPKPSISQTNNSNFRFTQPAAVVKSKASKAEMKPPSNPPVKRPNLQPTLNHFFPKPAPVMSNNHKPEPKPSVPPIPPVKRPIPPAVPNCEKPTKKCKIVEADVIARVLAKRRQRHDNMIVSPMKPLGPPPITTKKFAPPTMQQTSTVLQSQISMLTKEFVVKNFSTDGILLKILEWSVQWLRERKTMEQPPPVAEKPLVRVSQSYLTWESYYDTFEPLVLHEIWSQMVQSYENETISIVMHVAVASYELTDGFLKLDCQTTLTSQEFKDQAYLNEGDLTLVELQTESLEKRVVFGYVNDIISEDLTDRTPILRSYKVPTGHKVFIKFSIKVKSRQIRLNTSSLMRIRGLYYLKPMLRNFEALMAVQNSKLCDDILQPKLETCQMQTPNIDFKSKEFNESQSKAILAAVEAVQKPYLTPKLLMVQGPPGTGKTTTLIGMIKKLFESWADPHLPPKILVCAPSNGAIDEIARRVYHSRHFLSKTQWKRQLRCVRIGMLNQMHPSARKMSLDELVCDNMSRQKTDVQRSIQEQIDKLESNVADKDRMIADYRMRNDKENIDRCYSDMASLNREIDNLRKELKTYERKNDIKNEPSRKRLLRVDILRKADVVLSTLNSCRQSLVEAIYHNDREACAFNCVIIDEASQCCEPEILMPLMYTSISKMILIGDPKQLSATVISTVAAEYKYDLSLFERFYKHFDGNSPTSPILMLDTQYRMHSSICHFPSNQFYAGRLKTHPKLDSRPFPLKPYVIIDLKGTEFDQSDSKNLFNELEATFVTNLYTSVQQSCPLETSVGIITPYQGQRRILSNKISQLPSSENVEVNTIDGFQGQEKDVIIISFVRELAKGKGIGFLGSPNRLNVALTRAKHSLIIVLSDIGEVKNSLWKALIEDAQSRNVIYEAECKKRINLKQLITK